MYIVLVFSLNTCAMTIEKVLSVLLTIEWPEDTLGFVLTRK